MRDAARRIARRKLMSGGCKLICGLVGWGTGHFSGDKYSAPSDSLVLLGMAHRIAQCVSLGLVLSWLAMRSGSVLLSIITHSMANFLQVAGLDGDYPGKIWVRTALGR